MPRSRLNKILQNLSPENLRGVVAPHDQWREDFVPRFLSTDSYEDMMNELGRFVSHMKGRWLGTNWPHQRGLSDAHRLIESTIGRNTAMKTCRYADQGGMRQILDTITRTLQKKALQQHIDARIVPDINGLNAEESLDLGEAYLDEFRDLGIESDSPASIVMRWSEVIHEHARLVLT